MYENKCVSLKILWPFQFTYFGRIILLNMTLKDQTTKMK